MTGERDLVAALAETVAAARRERRSYVRSQDGRRWHRTSCPDVRPSMVPWHFAHGMTGAEIVADLAAHDLTGQVVPCRRCKPEETP